MNKKLKSIATTVAAVGIGWSGLAQAATVHRTTSTRTVVVEKPKSAGQIAGCLEKRLFDHAGTNDLYRFSKF